MMLLRGHLEVLKAPERPDEEVKDVSRSLDVIIRASAARIMRSAT